MMPSKTTIILLAFSFVFVAVLSVIHRPFDPDRECCDHLFYRAMAGGTQTIPEGNRLDEVYSLDPYYKWFDRANGLTHQPPYVYRPLAPFLARFVGFFPLTFLSLVIAAACTGLAAIKITGRAWAGIFAIIVFLSNRWVSEFYLHDYMLTDPLAYALTALAVVFLFARRRNLFYLAAILAIFAKETTFPVALCYLFSEFIDRRVTIKSFAYPALVYGSYIAFRMLLPVLVSSLSISTLYSGFPGVVSSAFSLWRTYGLLLPLAFFGMRRRELLPLLPLSGILLTLLLEVDPERTLIHAFPLVILPAAVFVASYSQRSIILFGAYRKMASIH